MTKLREKSGRNEEGKRRIFLPLSSNPTPMPTFLGTSPTIWTPGAGYYDSKKETCLWLEEKKGHQSYDKLFDSREQSWDHCTICHIFSLKNISSKFTINVKSLSSHWYTRTTCTFLASGWNGWISPLINLVTAVEAFKIQIHSWVHGAVQSLLQISVIRLSLVC